MDFIEMPEPKPAPSRKRVTLAVLAICVLAIAISRISKRGQPERLAEFEYRDTTGTVRAGNLIWTLDAFEYLSGRLGAGVYCRPVTGGPERILTVYEPEFASNSNTMLAASENDVYFGLTSKAKPLPTGPPGGGVITGGSGQNGSVATHEVRGTIGGGNGGTGGAPVLITRRHLGRFEASNAQNKRIRDVSETRIHQTFIPEADDIHIRSASILGGPSRDLCTLHGNTILLIGGHALWTLPKPYTETTITRGNSDWIEASRHDDLMWIDLETRAERCIHTGYTPVQATRGESGALWTEPQAFPQTSQDLYYARAADGNVFHIGQIAADESIGSSAELKGALYWFVMPTGSTHAAAQRPDRLMAADLGSVKQRIVLRLNPPEWSVSKPMNLFVWRSSLYCLVSRSSGSTKASTYLALVHPGWRDPPEIIQELPYNLSVRGIDGGYLYYNVTESNPSLLSRMIGDNAAAPKINVLYRYRLPG